MSEFDFLRQPYSPDELVAFMQRHLGLQELAEPVQLTTPIAVVGKGTDAPRVVQLGYVEAEDGKKLPVFEVVVSPSTQIHRNRVLLRNLVAKQPNTRAAGAAMAVFFTEAPKDAPAAAPAAGDNWRLSFVSVRDRIVDGQMKTEETASKRFTFLLGRGAQTRTVEQRLKMLQPPLTIKSLESAFAVEPLTKEFYKKLLAWYNRARGDARPAPLAKFPNDHGDKNHTETALIRLITRVLFIWFIKEKGMVSPDLFDKDKVAKIIDWTAEGGYYKAILQNLFFATLNVKINEREFRRGTSHEDRKKQYGDQYCFRYHDMVQDEDAWLALFANIPFLNGGLFDCLDKKASKEEIAAYEKERKKGSATRPERLMIRVDGFSERPENSQRTVLPNVLFFSDDAERPGLMDILSQYQFTTDESTTADADVALDPELLGKVFENLLATYNPETETLARNEEGSFYTPRPIVDYIVNETISHYMKNATGLSEDKIRQLLDENATEAKLSAAEKLEAIAAIDGMKILDPAVGSGAFAMGALQRLVGMLEKLDPKNEQYKRQQLDKAEEIEDGNSREASISEINEVFSADKNYNLYGKKLSLIKNCIYGVDKQPIAITIAKLRFFISLTIEQERRGNADDNYGIQSLPNLETKLVVADTLQPLGKLGKIGLFDATLEDLYKRLDRIRGRYFSAKTVQEKEQIKKDDKALRGEILAALAKAGVLKETSEIAKRIANWDIYDQQARADWFDSEWMFGVKDGYNAVIGNPPYIQLQNNGGELSRRYAKAGYETLTKTGDIYQLFFERAYGLLHKGGNLCFITSSTWLKKSFGKTTRVFFSKNGTPLRLLDLGQKMFSSAAVDTCILQVGKENNDGLPAQAVRLTKPEQGQDLGRMELRLNQLPHDGSPWVVFSSAVEESITQKVKSIGQQTLADWTGLGINTGILTGLDGVFIVDNAKKAEILKGSADDSIFKKIIKGRINPSGEARRRFIAEWNGQWLICSHNGYDGSDGVKVPRVDVARDHPQVKRYLDTAGENLHNRLDQGATPYNLRACTYIDAVFSPKIILPVVNRKWAFPFVSSDVCVTKGCTFLYSTDSLIEGLQTIQAILASALYRFYWRINMPMRDDYGYETKKESVESLPLPDFSVAKAHLSPIVARIWEEIGEGKREDVINITVQELNREVYALFGLSKQEIAHVEMQIR